MPKTYIDIEYGTPVNGAIATLSTALTGNNNDIVYTSKLPGALGNRITVSYVKPDAANAELSATVTTTPSGNTFNFAIVVNLATDVSKNITTTAEEVVELINTHSEAKKLVTAALKGEDTGKGVVTTLAAADGKLQGGVNGTPANGNAMMIDGTNLYVCINPNGNKTNDANWRKIQLAAL
jgi:hypothetical protein